MLRDKTLDRVLETAQRKANEQMIELNRQRYQARRQAKWEMQMLLAEAMRRR